MFDWVFVEGIDFVVDLGDGYLVEIIGKWMDFMILDYGIVIGIVINIGVDIILFEGEILDYVWVNLKKLDVCLMLDCCVQVI